MVDDGLNLKETEKRMGEVGVDPKKIMAIFLTHEHNDHLAGVVAFAKKYGCLVFLHKQVFLELSFMFEKVKDQVRVFDCNDFYFGALTVSPFATSHDAIYPVGFSFYHCGKKATILTDTGYVTPEAEKGAEGSDIVFVESNHDKQMLVYGPYNAKLKRRIASDVGHLSNTDCAKFCEQLARGGTRMFVLSHLSQANNTKQIARKTCENQLENAGFVCKIEVADQYLPTPMFEV